MCCSSSNQVGFETIRHAIYRIDIEVAIYNGFLPPVVAKRCVSAGVAFWLEAPRDNHAFSPKVFQVLLTKRQRQPSEAAD